MKGPMKVLSLLFYGNVYRLKSMIKPNLTHERQFVHVNFAIILWYSEEKRSSITTGIHTLGTGLIVQ